MTARPLVVGLGSPHGDDRAGWLVIDELHRCNCDPAAARIAHHPSDLLDWLPDFNSPPCPLLICDAAHAEAGAGMDEPGACRDWSWPRRRWPVNAMRASHTLPLEDVLEMARTLGLLPEEVIVWTIAGTKFEPLSEPQDAVRRAAEELAMQLLQSQSRSD